MKSSEKQLKDRGFVPDKEVFNCENASLPELLLLLQSEIASNRTCAARMLALKKEKASITPLCKALEAEKKLYTKIEICHALAHIGIAAVPELIGMLGKIGNNQYKGIPGKLFKKNSYPLPRDIAARTLIRIGKPALADLIGVLRSDNVIKISEAVDAIGFICFYDPHESLVHELKYCHGKFKENELLRWKITRAIGAFTTGSEFLKELYLKEDNAFIKEEIKITLGRFSLV